MDVSPWKDMSGTASSPSLLNFFEIVQGVPAWVKSPVRGLFGSDNLLHEQAAFRGHVCAHSLQVQTAIKSCEHLFAVKLIRQAAAWAYESGRATDSDKPIE